MSKGSNQFANRPSVRLSFGGRHRQYRLNQIQFAHRTGPKLFSICEVVPRSG